MMEQAKRAGRELRQRVPRSQHAGWEASPQRRHPVDILEETAGGRVSELLPLRYGRMARSPFAFFRGAAAIMAEDLATTPMTGLHVQVCGDCHLLNFGGFLTPERRLSFDLNDFDETLPGAWEWDVKRLAASFVLAARENGFGEAGGAVARAAVRAYRERMSDFAELGPLETWYTSIDYESLIERIDNSKWRKAVLKRVAKARTRTAIDHDFPRLTEEVDGKRQIRDEPPLLYHPTDLAEYEQFESIMRQAVEGYRESLSEDFRLLFDRYEFVDAAIKVVGVGSVGTFCCIALMMARDRFPLFLQLKEARRSVLEPYFHCPFAHQGERVVVGQRRMQAASDVFLGWTSDVNGRQFYLRQLRDGKLPPDVASMDADRMLGYARLCGAVLARAHARTGEPAAIAGYLGRGSSFDKAVAQFALAYADQTERDHGLLQEAIASGRLSASSEE